jgi:LysM repeat protein
MQRNPENDIDQMVEEFADEMEYSQLHGNTRRGEPSRDPARRGRSWFPWAVVVVLIIGMAALLFRDDTNSLEKELKSLKTQLQQVDKRLASMEASDEKLGRLENQVKGLRRSVGRLEKSVARVNQSLEAKKKSAPAAKKATTTAKKTAAPKVKKRYHTVRKGESLYGIAKKYGLPVDTLRRLNNLNKKSVIRPGQKLLVSKGK